MCESDGQTPANLPDHHHHQSGSLKVLSQVSQGRKHGHLDCLHPNLCIKYQTSGATPPHPYSYNNCSDTFALFTSEILILFKQTWKQTFSFFLRTNKFFLLQLWGGSFSILFSIFFIVVQVQLSVFSLYLSPHPSHPHLPSLISPPLVLSMCHL